MKWIKELFRRKPQMKTIFSGIVSSKNPELSKGFVTVLTLKTQHDHTEFDEGFKDGTADFNNGNEMCKNLNFPVHPYARGYMEAYGGLQRAKQFSTK